MADIGIALRTHFLSETTITGVVETRIYAERLPLNATMPAIVIHDNIGGDSYEKTTGACGLGRTRVQVDCHAKTRTQAQQLREAVRILAQTFVRGTMGDEYINGCGVVGQTSRATNPIDGSDVARHTRTIDLMVSYTESTT